jgi:hypothetical protein
MKETYLNIDNTTYTTSGNAQKDKTPSLLTPTTKTTDNTPVNETDAIAQTLKGGNVLLVLATFFGFGLLLSLTPCIFPMIPILSSIIVQQSKQDGGKMSSSKGFMLSLIYVLAMSFAYTIAGVLAGVFGANIQAMLQNPFVIVAFAGIFVALALSMFGYYEIGLPSSWQTKLNKTSDESSKKISEKKNWGEETKGISSDIIPLDKFEKGGYMDSYHIASFLKRDGEIYEYGEDSPVLTYNYFYNQLKNWVIEKINTQKDQGPLEDLSMHIKNSDNPAGMVISIGATSYTEFGESTFLEIGDEIFVYVYDSNKYSFEDIKNDAKNGAKDKLENCSILHQNII